MPIYSRFIVSLRSDDDEADASQLVRRRVDSAEGSLVDRRRLWLT